MILKQYTIARSPQEAMSMLTDNNLIIKLSTNRLEVMEFYNSMPNKDMFKVFVLISIAEVVK